MSRRSSIVRAFFPAFVLGAALASAACDGSSTTPSPPTPSKPPLLAVATTGGGEIGVVGLDGAGYTRLVGTELCISTVEPCSDPAWMPDGESVLFTMGTLDPGLRVHLHVADRARNVRRLVPPGGVLVEELWGRVSPDGRWVYLTGRTAAEGFGVWRVAPDGSNPTRVGPAPVPYGFGADRVYGVSPDGRRVLIESVRSGIQRLALVDLSTGALAEISPSGLSVASSPAAERVARMDWTRRHLVIQDFSGNPVREVFYPEAAGGDRGNGLAWAADGSFLLARNADGWNRIESATGSSTVLPGLSAYYEIAVGPRR